MSFPNDDRLFDHLGHSASSTSMAKTAVSNKSARVDGLVRCSSVCATDDGTNGDPFEEMLDGDESPDLGFDETSSRLGDLKRRRDAERERRKIEATSLVEDSNEEKARLCFRGETPSLVGAETELEEKNGAVETGENAALDGSIETGEEMDSSLPSGSKGQMTLTPTRKVRFMDETTIPHVETRGSQNSHSGPKEQTTLKLAKEQLEQQLKEKLRFLEEQQAAEADSLPDQDQGETASPRNDESEEPVAKEERDEDSDTAQCPTPTFIEKASLCKEVANVFSTNPSPKAENEKPATPVREEPMEHTLPQIPTQRPNIPHWRSRIITRLRDPRHLPIFSHSCTPPTSDEVYPDLLQNNPTNFPREPTSQLLLESEQTITFQQTHMQVLEAQNKVSKDEIAKWKTCVESCQKTIGEMARVETAAQNEIAGLKERLSEQSDQYRLRILEETDKCRALEEQVTNTEKELSAAQKEIQHLQQNVCRLNACMQDSVMRQREIERLEDRNKVLEDEKMTAEVEIEELKFELRNTRLPKAGGLLPTEMLEKSEQTISEQQSRIMVLEGKYESILAQNEDLTRALENSHVNHQANDDHDTKIDELRNPILDKDDEIARLSGEIIELKHQASDRDNTIHSLQDLLAYQTQATDDHDAKMDELQKANSDKEHKTMLLEARLEDLQDEAVEQFAEFPFQENACRLELHAKNDKVKEIESLKGSIKELQNSLALESQSNAEKASEIVLLKDQLESQVQEKKNQEFMLEAQRGALDIEIQANTNKGKIIASLRADYAKLDKENTDRGAQIFNLKTQYTELNESWRAVSEEFTNRHLALHKELERQKKNSNTDLCKADDRITEMRRELTKRIRSLQADIKQKDELYRTFNSNFTKLEKKFKASEVASNQNMAMLESSRNEVEQLKDQRSIAEAIAGQRKEEHDKIVEILKAREESIKHLEAGIKQLDGLLSTAVATTEQTKREYEFTISSKNRAIRTLGADNNRVVHRYMELRNTNEELRKERNNMIVSKDRSILALRDDIAMKWEEDAEDSDVASVDSQDSNDEVDDERSIPEDLTETHSYEDLQADYESDLEREEEKGEGVGIEIVDMADVSESLDYSRSYGDLPADGESDEGWSVMSEGPIQGEAAEQDSDETFTDVASEISDDAAVAAIESSR
ncbi:hypothetical protein E2P81_ATG02305 [Venturia nashicola]|nr:hypothetical protein E2P81_ATG02305 [Venturia nashicola]